MNFQSASPERPGDPVEYFGRIFEQSNNVDNLTINIQCIKNLNRDMLVQFTPHGGNAYFANPDG